MMEAESDLRSNMAADPESQLSPEHLLTLRKRIQDAAEIERLRHALKNLAQLSGTESRDGELKLGVSNI